MTFEAAFTLGVVLVVLVLLAQEWLAPDLVLLGALGVVAASGVLTVEEALAGFADPTLLAIGALFVVATGLRATGVLRKAAHLLLGERTGLRGILARLTTTTAVSSAFLNNTPIVAMGIPAVISWTRGRAIPPSKLLIPLSFASILGGASTLIGTSTNLVADGLLRSTGREGLGFFELASVGVPLAVVGVAYLVLVAPALLPDRAELDASAGEEGLMAGDVHLYRVPQECLAVGRTLQEAGLGTPDLHLARLVRESGKVVRIRPEAAIRAGDVLTFRGGVSAMKELADRLELERAHTDGADIERPVLREVVIPPGSTLAESRLGSVDFRSRYGAAVLGVVRGGDVVGEGRDVVLRPGDTLLLLAPEDFGRIHEDARDFHLIGGPEVEPEELADVPVWRGTRAKAGLAILGGVVVLASTGVVHISVAALLGALAMVGSGFVSPGEARRSVDWSVLLVIGAAIGLGTALQQTGAADLVARAVVAVGEPLGPRGILAALLVGSLAFTLVVTNNAAIAILFPVAVSVAVRQGLDARPFVVAVTVAASLAFATPVGYQTNLMVYGPGGYRFGDFVRAGAPLQVITAVLAVILIPLFWGF